MPFLAKQERKGSLLGVSGRPPGGLQRRPATPIIEVLREVTLLERALTIELDDRQDTIRITVGSPKQEREDYSCRVTVSGGGFNLDNTLFGVDSMQAALLAIRFAKRVIEESEKNSSNRIYWLDRENGIDM